MKWYKVDLYQNLLRQLTTRVTAEFHQDSDCLHLNRSRQSPVGQ